MSLPRLDCESDMDYAVRCMAEARSLTSQALHEWPQAAQSLRDKAKGLEAEAMKVLGLSQPKAIIYVDGKEVVRCFDDDYESSYKSLQKAVAEQEPNVQHEYVLMVWNEKYRTYIRRRLEIKV